MAEFSSIENLAGSDNSQDGFVFLAGGSISGTVTGGNGGPDSLVVEDPAEEGPFTMINPASSGTGTLTLYGKTITYAGLEPIVDTSSAGAVVIHGSVYDDALVLEDKDPSALGEMQIRNTSDDFFDAATGSFVSTLSFANPASTLGILLGWGETLSPWRLRSGFQRGDHLRGTRYGAGADETNRWSITS
jgi:hypothetical protein